DKEGFLRSDRSLIQTIGRAARNASGKAILYADRITGSMQRMMDETNRRREIQLAYNRKHGIIPQTIIKSISEIELATRVADARTPREPAARVAEKRRTYGAPSGDGRSPEELMAEIEAEMRE